MKKYYLCLTLAIAFACKSFAIDFVSGGIYYNIIGNGRVEVTSAYRNYYSGSIVIPSSVTYISTTYSVTSIGDQAFSGCSGLTSITIPNSVTSIGDHAFYGCDGLTSITIPNSVTSIGSFAFSGCSGLTSISIPNSMTHIGYATFSGCSGLTSISIPNSMTHIGYATFSGCSGLTSISISNSLTSIPYYTFAGCSGLTSITIPNSVISIGFCAFQGCSGLTSVTIGSSVTSIGDYAFEDCSGLTEIICHAATPPTIEYTTFDTYQYNNVTLYVPTNSVTLYQSTVYWENFYILPMSEEPTQLEYNLADRNVVYCNNIVYNEDGLDIRLFDTSGRMIASGNGNIDMSDCPNGIYIVTDGKGGFLKINHYR